MTWKRFYEIVNPVCPLCGRRCGMLPLIAVACAYCAFTGAVSGAVDRMSHEAKIHAIQTSVNNPVDAVGQRVD